MRTGQRGNEGRWHTDHRCRNQRSAPGFETTHKYSIAPSRGVDGELPWVNIKAPAAEGKTSGLPVAFEKLPPGAVTPESIPVDRAWINVKLDAKRPMEVPAFNQAQATIRQQREALAPEKANAQFVGGLLKNATIR
ncbi:peptidylprolyl isomerase [Burkholderia ubonensis]|uniref:peptidylprolyl isomerase n=1 Tax=Burkholderia ubonensis TaxID=101571 RepID=UPI001E2D48F7|nr:peptidylprolyl isomerase [Burkholderia ubonensis]